MRWPWSSKMKVEEVTTKPHVSTSAGPIEEFATNYISKKLGGLDTKRAYMLRFVKSSYSSEFHRVTTHIKKDNAPDLFPRHVITKVGFATERIHEVEIDYRDYREYSHHLSVFLIHYIDEEIQTKDGRKMQSYDRKEALLDDTLYCTMINSNWDKFVAALDDIVAQIVADCGKDFTFQDPSKCRAEILKKIQVAK